MVTIGYVQVKKFQTFLLSYSKALGMFLIIYHNIEILQTCNSDIGQACLLVITGFQILEKQEQRFPQSPKAKRNIFENVNPCKDGIDHWEEF